MYYSLKLGCLSKSWGGENIVTFSLFNSFKVFISGTKSECRKVLQTILKNRRLCSLLSPFFTPNATPAEFIQLYEKVVKFLSEDNSDMIFMLLTKVSCHSVLMLSLKCRYCCCFPAPSELCLQVNWRLTGRFLIWYHLQIASQSCCFWGRWFCYIGQSYSCSIKRTSSQTLFKNFIQFWNIHSNNLVHPSFECMP